jgi:hypothetical protein
LDAPLGVEGTETRGISGTNIVGFYLDNSNTSHGFLYNGSTYITLDDPLGVNGTGALGISGADIVGYYSDGSSINHGFLATPTIPLTVTHSVNIVKISWPYPSANWTLQQNPDLSTTNWTPSAGISNDGTNNFITMTLPTGNLFFRLSER